jgi:hypothetical protein
MGSFARLYLPPSKLDRVANRMNTPLEELFGKIRKALAAGEVDKAVAAEFAEFCDAANTRLAECIRHRDEGVSAKAVRGADESPALLEVVEEMGRFHQLAEWLAFCNEHSLPVASPIAAGAAGDLVAIYRSWGGTSKFLWKKYRDAVIRRDEVLALGVALRILKAEPSDQAARDEVNRILRRDFREKLAEMDELVECEDRPAAIVLADGLDKMPFADLKKGRSWDKVIGWRDAQRREGDEKRIAVLIGSLERQRKSGELELVMRSVAEIGKIVDTHKLELDSASRDRVASSAEWGKAEGERRMREAGAREVVGRCEAELQKIETNWAILTKGPIGEMEGARRKLTNCWKEVEKIGSGIGGALGVKVTTRNRELDKAIGKRKAKRRRKVRMTATGVALVNFLVGYYLYAQWRGGVIVDEMAAYRKAGKAIPLNSLVKSLDTYRLSIAKLAPIGDDLAKEREWLAKAYGHKDEVEASIAKLDEETAEEFGRPVEDYLVEIIAIKAKIVEAAVDLKPLLEKRMAALNERWEAHAIAYVAAQNKRREQAFEDAEKLLSGMPRLDIAARSDAKVEEFGVLGKELEDSMTTKIPPSAPGRAVVKRAEELGSEVSHQLERMAAFRETLEAVAGAESFDRYQAAMLRFRDGDFDPSPEQTAARALFAKEKTEFQVIGEILIPGDPESWTFFGSNRDKDKLFPKSIDEADRGKLEALGKEGELKNLYRCRFEELPGGKVFTRYSSGATVLRERKVGPTSIFKRSGMFFERGSFGSSKYELKKGRGTRLLSEELSAETKLLRVLQPADRLMSRSQQYYRAGMLELFDDILAAGDAHPLFKAYVHRELGLVISRHPEEWGTVFVPRLMKDLADLAAISPSQLTRTDWMTAGKYVNQAVRLREFYAAREGYRYAFAAKINRRLIKSATDAGFGLAGHVAIDGSVVLRAVPEAVQLIYGAPSHGQPARAVFRRTGEEAAVGVSGIPSGGTPAGWEALGEVAALSPLMYFKGERASLLESVAGELGVDVEEVRASALPFFTEGERDSVDAAEVGDDGAGAVFEP